jgi:hypothetical protein
MANEQTEVNPLRAQMVRNVMMHHSGEPLTVEHLRQHFEQYPQFDFGQDDLDHWKAQAGIETEFEPDATAAPVSEQTPAPEVAADAEPAPPTQADIDAAVIRRNAAELAVANGRVVLITAQNAEKAARAKLAKAVSDFQSGFQPFSHEQLARAHIASELATRQARADGLLPPRAGPGIGKSAVDRAAYYSKYGHGPNAGGGNAYARPTVRDRDGVARRVYPSRFRNAKLPSEA